MVFTGSQCLSDEHGVYWLTMFIRWAWCLLAYHSVYRLKRRRCSQSHTSFGSVAFWSLPCRASACPPRGGHRLGSGTAGSPENTTVTSLPERCSGKPTTASTWLNSCLLDQTPVCLTELLSTWLNSCLLNCTCLLDWTPVNLTELSAWLNSCLLDRTPVYLTEHLSAWLNSWQFTNQHPASCTLFLWYFHSLSFLCVFFMLHCVSGIVSLAKLDHRTRSHF